MQLFDSLALFLCFFGVFYTFFLHHIQLEIGTLNVIKQSGAYYQVITTIFVLALFLFVIKEILLITLLVINKSKSPENFYGIFWSLILPFWFESLLKQQLISIFYDNEDFAKAMSNKVANNYFIFIFLTVVYIVLMVIDAQVLKMYFYYAYYKYYWIHALYLTFIFSLVLLSILLNSFIKIRKIKEKTRKKVSAKLIFMPWKLD
ncbi:hypothetical protein [Mycoplasmopsis glycophila]|nr:hypothetical protein [Mycoplasmopsis glycophila]